MKIAKIQTTIVDVPTTRAHKLSNAMVTHQSYVIVCITLKNGQVGYGEASTLGGPRWAEESVESIKAVIDHYFAPVLINEQASNFEQCGLIMRAAAKRNFSAKAAVESALFDAVGKTLGLPASTLLGGKVRNSIPAIWGLASGDAEQEIEEAKLKIERGQFKQFKIKFGFLKPADDVSRLQKIVEALPKDTKIIVDVNQGWSEAEAIRWLPALCDLNVSLIEQPLPAKQMEALARIACRIDVPIMVDEGAITLEEIRRSGDVGAGSVLSLKLVKSGGLLELKRAAAVANTFGMQLYGGCLLESGIGAAAHLAVFSTLPNLDWGTEQFGPIILKKDLLATPLIYENFELKCPDTPGLGISVSTDKIKHYARR